MISEALELREKSGRVSHSLCMCVVSHGRVSHSLCMCVVSHGRVSHSLCMCVVSQGYGWLGGGRD